MSVRTPLLITVVLATAAAFGCSDGGGARSVTLEEYLRAAEQVNVTSEARIGAASQGVQDLGPDTPFEDLRDAFDGVYREFGAIAGDARDDLDVMKPPSEAEDQHGEMLAGLEELETAFDGIRGQVRDAATPADLGKVVESASQSAEVESAQNRVAAACAALQATADANAVEVDLNCGG